MKKITLQEIRDLNPCYDPAKFLPEDWTGTLLDILNVENCPADDRLWVVLTEQFIDAKTLRLFAVWCAREALRLIENPDARSINACNVAERYANGEATDEELAAARASASAAWAERAESAAWDADSAAWAARAARAASAPWDADSAAWAARDARATWAARAAWAERAERAASAAQITQLVKMLS
jgi:hypothetical protein